MKPFRLSYRGARGLREARDKERPGPAVSENRASGGCEQIELGVNLVVRHMEFAVRRAVNQPQPPVKQRSGISVDPLHVSSVHTARA